MLPRVHASPLPTYMTFRSDSATAMAPIEAIFCSSKTGFHVAAASVLFHTPPATAPKYHVDGSPGTPVTASTRPPRKGPIWRHFIPDNSDGLTSAIAPSVTKANAASAMPASKRLTHCMKTLPPRNAGYGNAIRRLGRPDGCDGRDHEIPSAAQTVAVGSARLSV